MKSNRVLIYKTKAIESLEKAIKSLEKAIGSLQDELR
jgi:prefoldin subunit 5